MKDRIIEVRNCVGKNGKKMTQEEFANKLNLSRNFIIQIETGTRNPSDRTIVDICREFNVNEEWLRTGKGEMFLPLSRETEIAKLTVGLFKEESDSFKNRFISMLARMTDEEWALLESMVDKLKSE